MLTWYAQEQPTSCVAACVRMVLTGFEVVWTEGQVRTLLGRPRLGITFTAAHARLVHAGARVALHADWGLDDLRETLQRGHSPIVGVERHLLGYPPASHAIVVVQITSRAVQALDPLEGPRPQRYGRDTFLLAWQAAGHEALVVEVPPLPPTP
ncbi:MAG TPA: papain-like cysteine protease family protein [Candidatus Tectomicrobia bacterium]